MNIHGYHLVVTVLLLRATCRATEGQTQSPKPHIIFILADDLGWNDISFHGSNQIPTPNIDALGYTGCILQNYYTGPICTPSRAAFLTGKQPYQTGMQHYVLQAGEPRGLPLNYTLLPQYLKRLNYKTHLVGKWNLGHYKKEYTPTYRGFDSHLGFWTGHQDQFDHFAFESSNNPFITGFNNPGETWKGLDMRRGLKIARDLQGNYSTRVFTKTSIDIIKNHNKSEPLFLFLSHAAVHSGNPYNMFPAPEETVANFSYIDYWKRQRFAAMVAELDNSVGQVIEALKEAQILDQCLIVFTSDNGAPLQGAPDENYGSNFPLKGNKYTLFEGGNRVPTIFWTSNLKNPGSIRNQLVHITDWLPTFYSAAGGNPKDLPHIYGVDQWEALTQDLPSKRNQLVYNIDGSNAAIRIGDWKYIAGGLFGGALDAYSGSTGREEYPFIPAYNISNILSSPAHRALAAVSKAAPLTSRAIRTLRRQAKVRCVNDLLKNSLRTSSCRPLVRPCLLNLADDPCETTDLSDQYPDILKQLKAALTAANATYVTPGNLPNDPRADPKYWGYTWTRFGDNPIDDCQVTIPGIA